MPLFDFSNLPYWILLSIGIMLFVFVIISGGGDDDIDVDSDVDIDSDLDLDADADADADADSSDFSLGQVLGVFGIGKAPFVLLLAINFSLWGLIGWFANVMFGKVLDGFLGGAASGAILLGSLVLSLLSGGQIARPIGRIFASFGEDVSRDRLIGCLGTVSTAEIPVIGRGRIGQVDVLDPARNLVTVNAVLPEWADVIPQRGMKVLVIEQWESSYVVIMKDSSDQDRWLHDADRLKRQRA